MSLFEPDIEEGLKYDAAKHAAEEKAEEAAQQNAKEKAEAAERHQHNKEQGMI